MHTHDTGTSSTTRRGGIRVYRTAAVSNVQSVRDPHSIEQTYIRILMGSHEIIIEDVVYETRLPAELLRIREANGDRRCSWPISVASGGRGMKNLSTWFRFWIGLAVFEGMVNVQNVNLNHSFFPILFSLILTHLSMCFK